MFRLQQQFRCELFGHSKGHEDMPVHEGVLVSKTWLVYP